MLVERTPGVGRYRPFVSQIYRPGLVSGILTEALPSGTASHATWAARLDASLALLPAAWLSRSALPWPRQSGTPRLQPLTLYNFDNPDGMGVFLNPLSRYGGLYAAEQATLTPSPSRAIFNANAPDDVRNARSTGGANSSILLSATLLHEYGHHVDNEVNLIRTGVFTPATGRTSMLTQEPIWQALYARVVTPAYDPTAPFNYTYGFTNMVEWFAEIFATRVLTNLRAGEALTWGSNRYQPRLIHCLCGYDDTLYADVMALFTSWFPQLSSPSPKWDTWGAPPV